MARPLGRPVCESGAGTGCRSERLWSGLEGREVRRGEGRAERGLSVRRAGVPSAGTEDVVRPGRREVRSYTF